VSRLQWQANLGALCLSLEQYTSANGLPLRHSAAAVHLSNSLYLASSTSDAKFAAICATGHLFSAAHLAANGRYPLPPGCAEVQLGTADSVFFYVSGFRYPNTGCGLLFAHTLEFPSKEAGVATPFDSGGLLKVFTRGNAAEPVREFLSRHELPIPEHRQYLRQAMDALFDQPQDLHRGNAAALAGANRPGRRRSAPLDARGANSRAGGAAGQPLAGSLRSPIPRGGRSGYRGSLSLVRN
jgi:hypothetical protein